MIIRGDKRRKAAPPPPIATTDDDLGDVLVDGLDAPQPTPEPTPEVEQEVAVEPEMVEPEMAEQPVKRGRGRPKGSTKKRELPPLFELPEGMTDDILAWACGVSAEGNVVYRWRTGFNTMPEIAHRMIALWNVMGEEEFLRVMAEVTKTPPPEPDQSIRDLILKSLKMDPGPWTLEEIHSFLTDAHKRHVTRGSLKTILSRMKANGEVDSDGRDEWVLPGSGA